MKAIRRIIRLYWEGITIKDPVLYWDYPRDKWAIGYLVGISADGNFYILVHNQDTNEVYQSFGTTHIYKINHFKK